MTIINGHHNNGISICLTSVPHLTTDSLNTWTMFVTIIKCLLLLTFGCVQGDCEIYQDRPKIKTSDGDLILQAALNKNIYLQPNGPKSCIFMGDNDYIKSNTLTDNVVKYKPSTNENLNGILERLAALETKAGPQVPDSASQNITKLWRSINNINTKIVGVQNLINRILKDECSSHPCQHGGTCLNIVNDHQCLCPSNWKGKDCDEDVNECWNFAGTDLGCQNGATCINRPGTYECLCKSGWYGLHCTRKANDCTGGDFEMCGHGTCIPVTSGEGIKCICHQGWTASATSYKCLTDVNECESYQGPRCSVNPKVKCVNLPGSFRCEQCPAGYEGDGYICYDIDECTSIPNGGCSPMVSCHNTIGSRVCGTCPPGYQGDGVTCTYKGSCNIHHGGCHTSAQCVEVATPTGQTVQCICPEEMDGDGLGLIGCYVSTGNYSTGCENKPCGIHGRCHSLQFGYTCICSVGYSGAHCDTPINVCADNPCQNGGTCRIGTFGGFRCECMAQYFGSSCQVRSKTCGGILKAEEGSISFPSSNTSTPYYHKVQCAWIIQTASDKVINVTFNKFNLELSPDCSSDFLQIHDGQKSSSQLIGTFCGKRFPKNGNIVSSHNHLYLWFQSRSTTVVKPGFALHWMSVKPQCGGYINATIHGHISSPGSPGVYPPNRDCYWHLVTAIGKRISLHFFALDIEVHVNCSFDYLAIYDGEHIRDPLLNRYCSSTQPAPVESASSEILIHFHSDAYSSGNGFQIVYAPVEGIPGCGGYFTANHANILSPDYYGMYMENRLCEYKIRTDPETQIKLHFETIDLFVTLGCTLEYLKVYDGSSADSQLAAIFCGNGYPTYADTYTSSSNTLFLQYKSYRRTHSRFRLSYERICNKTILGNSGIIKSPMYPFSYPNNIICVYFIKADPGKAIQLTFQDFDIEDSVHFNCIDDNVEIRNGADLNSSLLGRFCGGSIYKPPVQTSTHNYMFIKFQSDLGLTGSGFYANYTTIDISCGGIYDTPGLIEYPSGDATNYQNDQLCQWLILAPEDKIIKLTWTRFEIQDTPGCRSDHLEIIEEKNENSILGKYCGTRTPPALTTTTNRLKLKFFSDDYLGFGGFGVSYTFIDIEDLCGGNYLYPRGTIQFPGWRMGPRYHHDCIWIITVPVGQQISLNISNVILRTPILSKCYFEYIEVRNGDSQTSSLFGQFCGRIRYKRITSLANSLYINFHSQDSIISAFSSFNIEWESTIDGCGGTLTSSSGSISSPNYPNKYYDNAECFYKIVINAGSRIRVSFTELILEQSYNCRNDYIEIYDGRDTNAPLLGKFCSLLSQLTNIETSTNYAFIKFRSDANLGAAGFMLNYDTICNNTLIGRHGIIESPDYPNNYPSNLNCLWNIKVPKGNKINVTFTHFDVYLFTKFYYTKHIYGGCHPDYLLMKEAHETNYSKIFCGKSIPNAINTNSNALQIQFSTADSKSSGFRLEWVAYGCGGHIQKQFGTVNLDKRLITENEIECEWLIETAPGTSINITFTDIYLPNSKNCSTDSIEIYNGKSNKDPLLSKICFESHTSIKSDNNFLLIRFVKLSTMKDVYFTSQFHSSKLTCGGSIHAISGFVYSKNYPNNYENNLDCLWYITVPKHHRIQINVIEVDLYSSLPDSPTDNCADTILIYDSYTPSSQFTYQICQNSNNTQIVTKYNYAVVQFKTNNYGVARGFKASFSTICGGIISATHDGIITNNKYINHSNESCVWSIIAPTLDQKVSVTLTHMSLLKDTNIVTNRHCPSAFLRVLDGNDNNAPLIGEYCGREVPPMIVSHGNAITLELGSYTDTVGGIFSAHYSPMTNACGGTFTAEEGTIASPSYPSPYPVDVDCEWILSTSPGNAIYIMFEQFDLEYSEGCNEDYLELRENDGAGNLFGVYCGSDIPTNYTKSAKIYMKFRSNSRTSGRGFLLHYEYLHENNIQEDNGEIASPLYPIPYQGAGKYSWRILISGAGKITLTIDHVAISADSDINYNRLTIYDGYNNTAPILIKFDGVLDETINVQASSNVVYILLIMYESNTGSKFHLTWAFSYTRPLYTFHSIFETQKLKLEDSINCGYNQMQLILPGQIKILKSPKYLNNYRKDLNCEWLYRTQIGRHLSISFADLHLYETQGCYVDSISIYSADILEDWKVVKDAICTATAVMDAIDSSIYMKIKFKTNSNNNENGFIAQVSSKCGGLITDLSGEFGPIWIDAYAINTTSEIKCDWKIKVRLGRTIQLRFSHFNITNKNENCQSYVVLRNGDSPEASLLANGKYCGDAHENKRDIVTSSNSLYVSYTSKNHMHIFQNFKIYYEEKNYECGSTSQLTSDYKWETINSPNYPSAPVSFSECVWTFSGPPGEILRIDFIDRFEIDYGDDCGTEVVEIRDGLSSLSPSKGRYCGNKPATIKSTSNTIYIKYSTQLAEPRNGFKANISIDTCGGTIIADSGDVTSPGYPQMQLFPYGTVCEWHIIGPPTHVFLIKPMDIDLPKSESKCATKLDIDQNTQVSNQHTLTTICDNYIEGDIETYSNNFLIKLTIGKLEEGFQMSQKRGFRIGFNSSRSVCGGKITNSEGYLTTPNYPQETTLGYCQWLIEIPNKSRKIRLEIIDADQEKHDISIFNDFAAHTEIETILNDDPISNNQIYESVGNKIAVYVRVSRLSTPHRFKAKFTSDEQALCGGVLSDNNQEVNSPDLQQSYSCNWDYKNLGINDKQNNITYRSILITVTVNSSTTSIPCQSSDPQIRIESPVNDKSLSFQRNICGNTAVSFRIPSSVFEINAMKSKSDRFYFHMNWKSQPCGGTIHVGSNSINIINTPDSYNETLDCAWVLVIPINSRIEIKIERDFLLQCKDEYILITHDLNQNAPAIGSYCKDKLMESPLVLHYSYMYVQYHSKVKSNIKLMIKTVTSQCGGLLTSNQNVFNSPNYPKTYTANEECVWEIQADLSFRVSLQFIDRFAIEHTLNCTKDVIIIYDWNEEGYKEIARLCGRQTPAPIKSTHNRLKVIFRTDAETNLDGFKAQWTRICGGKFVATEKEHMLYSPGYPYNYPPNMNCLFQLSVAKSQTILLKFLEFDLEKSPECTSDNLTMIAEGDGILFQVFCGTEIPPTLHSYKIITFVFNTDKIVQRKGFKIAYSIRTCGGKVNNSTVITPNFGNDDYDNNMNCTWLINAPPTKIVVVRLLNIHLESHSKCYNDYIAIYDGPIINTDKRLALLCGYINTTTVLRSTNSNMVLEFITDSQHKSMGFKAVIDFTYSEAVGCGGRIDLSTTSSRNFSSPLIANVVYENFLDCHWSISSPPSTVIKITFTKFHISPCQNLNHTFIGDSKCDCDFVEIKDGLHVKSFVIGTYCGHVLPPQLITSQNTMSIRFSTDGEFVSSGFQASLTVQPALCGQSIIPVGFTPRRFKSLGYDKGSIPRGLHCIYHLNISAQPSKQVRITIVNLQLSSPITEGPDRNRCLKDRLIISSSTTHSNETVGQDLIVNYQREDSFTRIFLYERTIRIPKHFELCGHKEAIDYYVYGSTSINLITSAETESEVHRGVEIEVAFVGSCGRNYTESQGRILNSYALPRNDVANNCFTLITASENATISLYFLNILLDYSDHIEIFDGNKISARQLIRNDYRHNLLYPVFSTGRYMLLHVYSTGRNMQLNANQKYHLELDMNYVTTDRGPGCGGMLNNIVGTITSPFYPNTYRHKGKCEWVLETPVGTHVLIRFSVFDLGNICEQNYLQLIDSKGVVVRTFCSESPADYTSDDNYLKVVFFTTMNNSGRGWSAIFIGI